jgi:hypothetical protein
MSVEDANQIIEMLAIACHVLSFGFGVLAGMHR